MALAFLGKGSQGLKNSPCFFHLFIFHYPMLWNPQRLHRPLDKFFCQICPQILSVTLGPALFLPASKFTADTAHTRSLRLLTPRYPKGLKGTSSRGEFIMMLSNGCQKLQWEGLPWGWAGRWEAPEGSLQRHLLHRGSPGSSRS